MISIYHHSSYNYITLSLFLYQKKCTGAKYDGEDGNRQKEVGKSINLSSSVSLYHSLSLFISLFPYQQKLYEVPSTIERTGTNRRKLGIYLSIFICISISLSITLYSSFSLPTEVVRGAEYDGENGNC